MVQIMDCKVCPVCFGMGMYFVNQNSKEGKEALEHDEFCDDEEKKQIVDWDFNIYNEDTDKKVIEIYLDIRCKLCNGDFDKRKSYFYKPMCLVELFHGGTIWKHIPVEYLPSFHSKHAQYLQPKIYYDSSHIVIPKDTSFEKLRNGRITIYFEDIVESQIKGIYNRCI